ncbi:MAG: TonB-dependent receptor [Planctomycetota bacterium]|jgi:hemoglobin/transferrin/lactoferrin receptor protein
MRTQLPLIALSLALLAPTASAQDARLPEGPAPKEEPKQQPKPAPEPKAKPEATPAPAEDGKTTEPKAEGSDAPVARLTEVVVTPQRHAVDPFDVAGTVRTLDGATGVLERGGRTVPETAGQIAGVEVQKTAQGQGTVFMRGFTGFRTLMLFDGIRVNNSIFRSGPNEWLALIDPYLIGSMEAVEGPGSVLYGSDAVGGTVNILTPRLLGDDDGPIAPGALDLQRRLIYRYSTADRSNTVRGEVTGRWGNAYAVRVGGTWRDFDDLEGGRHVGLQPQTGFEVIAGDLTAEWRPAEGVRLRAHAHHLDMDDVMRTHKTIYGVAWHGTTVGSEIARLLDYERTHGALHLELDTVGDWFTDVKVSVSGTHLLKTRDRTRSSGKRDLRFVRVNTAGGMVQAATPLGDTLKVVYGADYYHDDVDSARQDFDASTGLLTSTKIQGSVADDARYDLFGAFAQVEWAAAPWLDVIVGGRFTYADTYAGALQDPATGLEISLDDSYTDFSASGRLGWKPTDAERVHVSLGQSFRAPNLSDLTRLDTAQTNEAEVPSPDLDPERFLTFEIGAKSRRGPVTMEAAYFYTWISDLIVRTPTGNLVGADIEVTKTNVGDGFVQGVSGQAGYRFDDGWLKGIAATVGGAWSEGEHDVFVNSLPDSKNSRPKSKMPPATGFVRLRYTAPDEWWWAEFEAKAARAQERLSPADERDTERTPPGGMPGYAVFGIRGGSGVNEAGLHAVFSVIWDF